MLSWQIHEDREQTAAVMAGLSDRASGIASTPSDFAVWHDLQRWIALGPNDAVIPFARQIASAIHSDAMSARSLASLKHRHSCTRLSDKQTVKGGWWRP
jgi:hypothetical protein